MPGFRECENFIVHRAPPFFTFLLPCLPRRARTPLARMYAEETAARARSRTPALVSPLFLEAARRRRRRLAVTENVAEVLAYPSVLGRACECARLSASLATSTSDIDASNGDDGEDGGDDNDVRVEVRLGVADER